jgi:GNAT superfamily N-acetyltransferase
MDATAHPTPGPVITRVAADHWHALDDDLVIGRGHTSVRPDGRRFISIDTWHDAVFDRLAAAMLADLPAPLSTLVDADDPGTTANWRRAGFEIHRRDRQYLLTPREAVPTPGVTVTGGDGEFRADGGVIRVLPLMGSNGRPRIARIVSVEVRAGRRRRGIGGALLAHALGALHDAGFRIASADVGEADIAGIRLLEGAGARHLSSSLELLWQK